MTAHSAISAEFGLDASPPAGTGAGPDSSRAAKSTGRLGRWKALNLSTRLKLVNLALMGFITALALTIVIGFSVMGGDLQRAGEFRAASLSASSLSGHVNEAALESERFASDRRGSSIETALAAIADSRKYLAQTRQLDSADPEFIRLTGLVGEQIDTLEDSVRSRADPEAVFYQVSVLQDTSEALSSHMNAMTELFVASGTATFETIFAVAIWALVLTFVIASFGLRLSRDFDRTFSALLRTTRRLGTGIAYRQLTIDHQDRSDELGDMARSLEVFRAGGIRLEMLQAEREAAIRAEHEAERSRASERAERSRERIAFVDRLAQDFESEVGRIVSSVASASSQLKSTATEMAKAAQHANDETAAVEDAMQRASSGATAAAAASDEFAMSIDEISRQAASSAELARKASGAADDADGTISALADSAAQVGQIVELIQSIAQKTNLLALNASIEAARGGEAGRGFAVVASEVKELAKQTSRATQDVAEQIRAIQGSTGNSVTALRTIGEQIRELEATSISIASAVDQQSLAGQELARSIDVAALNTNGAFRHVGEVREASIATGAASEQVLTSATELEGQAATLERQLIAFLGNARRNFELEGRDAAEPAEPAALAA